MTSIFEHLKQVTMVFNDYTPVVSSNKTRDNKEVILKYLAEGEYAGSMPMYFHDMFTGKPINVEAAIYCNDKFSWYSNLPYYVEKYNAELTEDMYKDIGI